MRERTWAVTVAALLLAGSAVALATNVQGQDFERQGQLDDAGSAYDVEWESEDAGKLRLSLDPDDGATAPSALVSVLEDGGERVGTYTLDEAWPRLDQHAEPSSSYVLVVHRAYQAEVDVLAEEGHPVDLDRLELSTETVELAEGDDEPIRRQVAVDRDAPFAHLGLTFQGDAEGLSITALNEDDETVLEAQADNIDTALGQTLVATLSPESFQTGTLLVRVQADQLNGTLGLEYASLDDGHPNVVTTPTSSDDGASQEDDGADDGSSDGNATGNATGDSPPDLREIAELEPGEPLAVQVPAGVGSLYVVGDEDCGEAILFGPEDELLGSRMLETDEGAREWNSSDEEHHHDDRVFVEMPVQTGGEHVLVLANSHEEGTLYMPVDAPVDHRTLDVEEIEGEIDGSNRTLLASSNGTAEAAIPGGLLGFGWRSDGADLERSVRLTNPAGETIYEAHGTGAGPMTVYTDHDASHPLVGPSGNYTIDTDAESLADGGMSYTLFTYER